RDWKFLLRDAGVKTPAYIQTVATRRRAGAPGLQDSTCKKWQTLGWLFVCNDEGSGKVFRNSFYLHTDHLAFNSASAASHFAISRWTSSSFLRSDSPSPPALRNSSHLSRHC